MTGTIGMATRETLCCVGVCCILLSDAIGEDGVVGCVDMCSDCVSEGTVVGVSAGADRRSSPTSSVAVVADGVAMGV